MLSGTVRRSTGGCVECVSKFGAPSAERLPLRQGAVQAAISDEALVDHSATCLITARSRITEALAL